jgi:DnaJ-class molecular chaperone
VIPYILQNNPFEPQKKPKRQKPLQDCPDCKGKGVLRVIEGTEYKTLFCATCEGLGTVRRVS